MPTMLNFLCDHWALNSRWAPHAFKILYCCNLPACGSHGSHPARRATRGFLDRPTPRSFLPLQDLETRNAELEQQLRAMECSLEEAQAERERARAEVGRAAQLLDMRLFELSELREGLARLAEVTP